ncbi:hypothetical protein LC574_21540, partial [Nostoc sp. CHAB 5715]|nr:hypothetical protein [Nostoc sp. CHAB 5715]
AVWALARSVGRARAVALTLLGDKLPAEKATEWSWYEFCSAIEEHRRNSFFSTHFVCKKAIKPCKESVLHHSIFPISVKLGTIVKGNKR